jgi:multidrug efflux system membrane fusion protein
MFTLIDTTTWYVVANYRESKLKNIRLGSPVDVLLMGRPDRKFHGHGQRMVSCWRHTPFRPG